MRHFLLFVILMTTALSSAQSNLFELNPDFEIAAGNDFGIKALARGGDPDGKARSTNFGVAPGADSYNSSQTAYVEVVSDGSDFGVTFNYGDEVTLDTSKTYKFSIMMKADGYSGGAAPAFVFLVDGQGANSIAKTKILLDTPSAYTEVSVEFQPTESQFKPTLRIGKFAGTYYFDNISIVEVVPDPNLFSTNPDFESGVNVNWSLNFSGSAAGSVAAAEVDHVYEGTSAKVAITTAGTGFFQASFVNATGATVVAGETYEFSIYGKVLNLAEGVTAPQIQIKNSGNTVFTATNIDITGDYQKISFFFTASENGTVKPQVYVGKFVGDYYFDNMSLLTEEDALSLEDQVLEENSVTVYPNPVSAELNIAGDVKVNTAYSIYNIVGKEVLSGKVSTGESINVEGFNSGMYFISVDNKSTSFIKQ